MADLVLEEISHAAKKHGHFEFNLIEGKKIKIQIGSAAEHDELFITCPAGKTWKGSIIVDFMERDA